MTNSIKKMPAVKGLFTWPSEEPRLIGSHCRSCNSYSFPKRSLCPNPNCRNKQVEEVLLNPKGKLWSYTVHYYQPPPPFKFNEPFKPFGIGVVELPEGIKILGMLTSSDLNSLKIGMNVELVVEKIYEDKEGNESVTWKFKPV